MRVMVLESQNRALIHEFKSLKELYSQYNQKPTDAHSHAWRRNETSLELLLHFVLRLMIIIIQLHPL